MSEVVYYNTEPEAIQYMALPDGKADVWLRQNITEVTAEDEWGWTAEETYIHTDLTRDEVVANFGELFEGSYDPDADTTLEGIRATKLEELSAACNADITAGVDVELSDGVHHFSLTTEDQLNLISLSALLSAGAESVPYHADGEECQYYSAEDFNAIVTAATTWVMLRETYYNSLKSYVNAQTDVDAIKAITYGCDIPEEYQSEVYKAMFAG